MKEPKEPKTFKYPRLYWRPKVTGFNSVGMCGFIIIYPDGRPAERSHSGDNTFDCDYIACWNEDVDLTPQEQVSCMKNYSEKYGYKTVFLGEIK